jgi:hypothetical protein
LRWRKDRSGAISVSGTVHNRNPTPVRNGAVGVILRGDHGELLAALYDPIDIANIPPMSSRTFTTGYPGTPVLDPKAIGSAEGFAFDLSR